MPGMWNWTYAITLEDAVSDEAIWQLYEDVKNWPSWDHDLEWATLDGSFEEGSCGFLKPKGFMKSRFWLKTVENKKRFVSVTTLPFFTTICFDHILTKRSDNVLQVTHKVSVSGPLAPILRLTFKKTLKKGLAPAIFTLLQKAKKIESRS